MLNLSLSALNMGSRASANNETVLFESDFGSTFQSDYPAVWSSLTTSNTTAVHSPSENYSGIGATGVNTGAVEMETKSGNFPYFQMQITSGLEAGKTYRVQAQVVVIQEISGGSAEALTQSLNGANSLIYENRISGTSLGDVLDHDDEFTLAGGATGNDLILRYRVRTTTNTGGSSGGKMALTYLKVSEV